MLRKRYNFGDVLLVRCAIGTGRMVERPAVVTCTMEYQLRYDEVLVEPVTTKEPEELGGLVEGIALQDWQTTGLGQPGWVLELVRPVDENGIVSKLGELGTRDKSQVREQMGKLVGFFGDRRGDEEEGEEEMAEDGPGMG